MTNFKGLKLNNWKQFEALDISFHQNLTVLTGANGSGKTTILNLLSRHFGWNLQELATPAKDEQTEGFTFFKRWLTFGKTEKQLGNVIGSIKYSSHLSTNITLPLERSSVPIMPGINDAQYTLQLEQMKDVKGLHIPSHRPLFFYQNVSSVPTEKRSNEQAFQLSYQRNVNRFNVGPGGGGTVNFVIKETLIGWAIAGGGNRFIEPDMKLEKNYLDFQDILKLVLPKSLGFKELSIRNYEVILVTESGDFMIDGASGGLSAIIDLAWQIYNFDKAYSGGFVVLIDEVENHLHPSMQRSVLPDFIKAFPQVQFIVTTHSPLIVGSVKDSNVYALRYNDDNRIYSELLDINNKSQTAAEILNEVLDVPVTMPIWVESKLNQIIEDFTSKELTEENLDKLKKELKHFGLEKYLPESVNSILKTGDKTK